MILRDSEAIAQVDDAQLQEGAFSGNVSLTRPTAGARRRRASMIAAGCAETARVHSFSGLEFDVELAQHTAVDVLPSGDAETEPGRDGKSEVRKTRKGEWWQFCGRSASCTACAALIATLRNVSGATGPNRRML